MDLNESPLSTKSGNATPSCLAWSIPCKAVRTVNNALLELLKSRFEMGTRVHILLAALDESANGKGFGCLNALDEDILASRLLVPCC